MSDLLYIFVIVSKLKMLCTNDGAVNSCVEIDITLYKEWRRQQRDQIKRIFPGKSPIGVCEEVIILTKGSNKTHVSCKRFEIKTTILIHGNLGDKCICDQFCILLW